MELELRHLRTIRAIAKAGSLNRAAAELGLPQPALSTQLRRIERSLGGPLFIRDHTGARLTALGELVAERARVIVPAMHELRQDAQRLANGAAGLSGIRLGGTHGPLLAGLVDGLARLPGQIRLTVRTSWSVERICDQTVQDTLDFALIGVCGQSEPPARDRLTWQVLGTDPVFVMLAEEHPLAGLAEIPLERLAGERWVSVPGDGCFGDCLAAACARTGFSPLTLLESDVPSCVHLAQVGRAVGLCRATFGPVPGIVTRPLAGAPLRWRHLLGWHPDGPAATAAPAIAQVARGAYARAARRNPAYAHWLTGHQGFGPVTAGPAL